MTSAQIITVTEADLPAIAKLAAVIWRDCYANIISDEQIEYMLTKMYSLDTMRNELRSGIRYERLLVDEEFAGFAAFGPTEHRRVFKLHKLYLLSAFHGRGFGSFLLRHCENEVRKLGAKRLILTVNKRNTTAVAAYERNGFQIVESVIVDIGGGFVMDDFVMAKDVTN